MRAILRAPNADGSPGSGQDLILWFDAGERFELPELSQPLSEVGFRSEPTEEEPESDDRAATEEVPRGSLLRLLPSASATPAPSPRDGLPPLLDPPTQPEASQVADARDDEVSTGLFEQLSWDEAPLDRRPHLSVVRVADASCDEVEGDLRAPPLLPPPRPEGWAERPVPQPRPVAIPPEWFDPELQRTLVVLDPTRRRAWAAAWRPLLVAAIDGCAWAMGFTVTFVAGGVLSSTTAATVLLALSL